MTRPALLAPLTAWLVAAALAPQAFASGFQLREQSPSAQGTAFAGVTAGGSDIGSMFYNPATMTLTEGNEAVIGFSYVMPKADLHDATATRAAALGGSPIAGPSSYGNSADSVALPNLYAMWSLSSDLKLGLSINAPFGMSTDYDSNFIGRYHALKSDLTVIDYAPSIAYRINPQWSVGATFVARKADAELTNAVDFGAIGASYHVPGLAPGSADGRASLKGSKWGYGYRLGVTFQPSDTVRLGLGYHSAMDLNLSGNATYSGVPAIFAITPLSQYFNNGSATAELNLPSTTFFGVRVDVSDAVAILGEVDRTNWSCFNELRVKTSTLPADSITEENWRDTWFCSLGLSWKATDKLTLRTGIAYDQSAVKDEYRTPRIPDGDRTWLSGGVGYAFTKRFAMDLAYTHIFVKDGPVELEAVPAGYTAANSPNFLRGDLSGSYASSIDIVSLQAKFDF
jgi:long-chain fatty acid transport protein